MALLENILIQGPIFAFVLTLSLLAIMKGLSPRIWGFSDYPKEVTSIVPPQTQQEKRIASILMVPFLIIGLGFPIASTLLLRASQGGVISVIDAFLNLFGLMIFGNIADLIILDILIVGTITPTWVIIPGTEHLKESAYKEFRKMHAKGHVWGTLFMAFLSLIIGVVIGLFQ